jgi:hypothetical protein
MEMEVTFLPGLENLGERLLAKRRDEAARKGETVWDAYLRRKRCGSSGEWLALGGGGEQEVGSSCLPLQPPQPARTRFPPAPTHLPLLAQPLPPRSEKKAEAKRRGRHLGSDESDSDYDDAGAAGGSGGLVRERVRGWGREGAAGGAAVQQCRLCTA